MFEVADARKWVRYQDLIGAGEPRQHPAGARAPAESVACCSPPARGEQPHGELRLHGYPRSRVILFFQRTRVVFFLPAAPAGE